MYHPQSLLISGFIDRFLRRRDKRRDQNGSAAGFFEIHLHFGLYLLFRQIAMAAHLESFRVLHQERITHRCIGMSLLACLEVIDLLQPVRIMNLEP